MLNPTDDDDDDDDGGDEDSEARSIDESNHHSFDAPHHIASLPGALLTAPRSLGLGQDFRLRIQSPLSSVIITSSTLYVPPVLFFWRQSGFFILGWWPAYSYLGLWITHFPPTTGHLAPSSAPKIEKGPLDSIPRRRAPSATSTWSM